ncbi:hypothetical protein PENSPDRAFT_695691, partial [Peniophora sp. CONT]
GGIHRNGVEVTPPPPPQRNLRSRNAAERVASQAGDNLAGEDTASVTPAKATSARKKEKAAMRNSKTPGPSIKKEETTFELSQMQYLRKIGKTWNKPKQWRIFNVISDGSSEDEAVEVSKPRQSAQDKKEGGGEGAEKSKEKEKAKAVISWLRSFKIAGVGRRPRAATESDSDEPDKSKSVQLLRNGKLPPPADEDMDGDYDTEEPQEYNRQSDVEREVPSDDGIDLNVPVKPTDALDDEQPMLLYDVRMALPRTCRNYGRSLFKKIDRDVRKQVKDEEDLQWLEMYSLKSWNDARIEDIEKSMHDGHVFIIRDTNLNAAWDYNMDSGIKLKTGATRLDAQESE